MSVEPEPSCAVGPGGTQDSRKAWHGKRTFRSHDPAGGGGLPVRHDDDRCRRQDRPRQCRNRAVAWLTAPACNGETLTDETSLLPAWRLSYRSTAKKASLATKPLRDRMMGKRIARPAAAAPFDASDMNQGPDFGADARVITVVSEQPLRQGRRGQTRCLLDEAFHVLDEHGSA
jgi:hypothetical protein